MRSTRKRAAMRTVIAHDLQALRTGQFCVNRTVNRLLFSRTLPTLMRSAVY